MAKYIVDGSCKLEGEMRIGGSKNATFPCVAAALLTDEPVVLENIPEISDVDILIQILNNLGVSVNFHQGVLTIHAQEISSTNLPEQLTTKLRGAVVLAGALISREGKVSFAHPGGDVIGKRSIDVHLDGFVQLGYKVEIKDRFYEVKKGKSEKVVTIYMGEPSVTGVENLILASVMLEGEVLLKNCPSEPHVVDLCKMLNKMGAKISGIGSSILHIVGVKRLKGITYRISSDYIEFGTYAVAAAITGGKIRFSNCLDVDLDPVMWPLNKMGVKFKVEGEHIVCWADDLVAISNLKTNIWPQFPTDLMSPVIVLATQANGVSLLHDWMYEGRMFFVDKLISMGANITIADPHRVVVYGPCKLHGRLLETPDIRAGMALVLAALVAEGRSEINRAELIERGYAKVVDNLAMLGAKIERVD